ncbi:MAG: PorP/SprF family type IX secretion system membrane protein [Candidatus Arcticimaribacter sp.]
MRTMLKNYGFFLLLLLLLTDGQAQQDPHISLYRQHLNMYNPAVGGIETAPELNMTFRSQWQGFKGAPETQIISFSTPTKNENVGLGFNVVHDKTFVEQQTLAFGSFSYRLQLKNDFNLYLGIQAGTNGYQVNAYNLEVFGTEGRDPNLINYSRFNPNVGVGLFLKHEKFYFSFSAPKILKSTRFKELNNVVTTATDQVHLYVSGGANLKLNDQWEFIPSTLIRYVNFAPFLITTNASLSYNKIIDFGVEYSFESAVGGTLMIDTGNTFSFGYAYVTSLHKQINQFSKGTHEVVMRIKLGADKTPKAQEDILDEFNPKDIESQIGTKNNQKSTGTRTNGF